MKLDAAASAPEAWQRRSIEDVCKRVTSGGTPSRRDSSFYEGGTVSWVKTKELNDAFIFQTEELITEQALASSSAKLLPSGTILLAMYGATVGMLGVLGKPMACNQACCALIPGNEIDRDYLYYQLLAHRDQLQGLATGAAQQNLSGSQIKQLILPFPTLKEQRAIGAMLRLLDDRITLLRETNSTLEAIAQALFKSWFVDFDPVRAKMEGCAPEGMDDATAALFPDALEETELGPVPRGWKTGTLGDVAQTARRQLQVSDLNADLNYVGLEHVPRKSLSLTEWGNAEGLESAKAAFAEGDILFGRLRPYFHKVVVAPFSGVCSTDILVCQPIRPEYSGVVTMHLFSEALIQYADRLSNGAKMPRVSWKDLAVYPISVPPPQVAEAYNKSLQSLMDRMKANIHQAQTLATLRDTLLPRLISGQLRVPEAIEANLA